MIWSYIFWLITVSSLAASQSFASLRASLYPLLLSASHAYFFDLYYCSQHTPPSLPPPSLFPFLPTQKVSTPKGITDLSTHILETSAIGSLTELQQIHTSLTTQGLKQEDNLLLVHLGVRNDIEGFRLENVGYNEASFDFPDERAFQPWSEAVSPTNPDTSFSLFSTLPLHAITRALHAKSPAGAGYSRQEVSISSNPGRFVCNFLYFHSLEMCRVRGHAHSAALFVHLPPFTRITEEVQFEFLERVLEMAACHFPR